MPDLQKVIFVIEILGTVLLLPWAIATKHYTLSLIAFLLFVPSLEDLIKKYKVIFPGTHRAVSS